MDDADHEVRLSVPASPGYVDVIRTVVGRQAHRLGFSFDGIEDVCLAVDEATVLLLELARPVRRIELSAALTDSTIEVSVSALTEPGTEWPPADLAGDMRWQVLTALAADVRVAAHGDAPAIVVRQEVR